MSCKLMTTLPAGRQAFSFFIFIQQRNKLTATGGPYSPTTCLIKNDYLGVITVTQKQFDKIMADKILIPTDHNFYQVNSFNILQAKSYFNGEQPKYYIYYNQLSSKGYLHINEIGYAPIVIPKK